MYWSELFDKIQLVIRKRFPEFRVAYKDENWFMKVLCVLLFFLNFGRTTTTIGYTVWYANRDHVDEGKPEAGITLAHEYVHMVDYKKQPFWFWFSYFSPQIWAVPAIFTLGAFWNLWFLLALVFLVFLAPWKSSWRVNWEKRGYLMSEWLWSKRIGSISRGTKEELVDTFSGATYYFMASKKRAEEIADEIISNISNKNFPKDNEAFEEVKELLEK